MLNTYTEDHLIKQPAIKLTLTGAAAKGGCVLLASLSDVLPAG
jgi:hypothetical protein